MLILQVCLYVTAGPVTDLSSGCGKLQVDQGGSRSPTNTCREVGTVGGEEGLGWRRCQERKERQKGKRRGMELKRICIFIMYY